MPVTTIEVPSKLEYVSVLDADGNLDEELDPGIPDDDLKEIYRTMVRVRQFDERRLRLQRQGRIGTFAPVKGQEATQLAVGYAMRDSDWMVPAFRETAIQIWRGMDMADDLLYAAGYEEGIDMPEDPRDMPIAIPVASQIAHAVGIAWARKILGNDDVVVTFFGDGATSHGDFHEPMNFAQVFDVPCVFVCQNNQYAISVPRSRQTKSASLAQKAFAHGMRAVQVDGNDVLAVYRVVKEAIDRARDGDGPTMVEAVTYRLSVHTTADDPTKYRSEEEVDEAEKRDPLPRLRDFLRSKDLLSKDEEEQIEKEAKEAVQDAVARFEEQLDPDPAAMFEHSVATLPAYIERQKKELEAYVDEFGRPGDE